MSTRRLPTNVLPFKQFVQRSRVLALYRSFLRETVGVERSQARDLRRCGWGLPTGMGALGRLAHLQIARPQTQQPAAPTYALLCPNVTPLAYENSFVWNTS